MRTSEALQFGKSLSIIGYPFFADFFVLDIVEIAKIAEKVRLTKVVGFPWNSTLFLYSINPKICSDIYMLISEFSLVAQQ